MKKTTKKLHTLILAAVMCITMYAVPFTAYAEDCHHAVMCTDETHTCIYCGETVTNYYELHSQVLKSDREHHWYYCEDCHKMMSPVLDHYYDCDADGTECSFCGKPVGNGEDSAVIKDEFKGIHQSYPIADEVMNTLCHYGICGVCGKMDEIHICNAVYTSLDENSHSRLCSCGEYLDDEDHIYNYNVTKDATVFEKGSETGTCEYCGYTRDFSISKLKPSIFLSSSKKSIKKGSTYTLSVKGLAKGDSVKSVKPSSGKVSVTKLSSKKYKIKAKTKGKTYVTVTLKSGKTKKCYIAVI